MNLTGSRTSHEVRGLKYKVGGSEKNNRKVAPHTRCVDWNNNNEMEELFICSRTSHEVRGLKYWVPINHLSRRRRTSHEVRGLK